MNPEETALAITFLRQTLSAHAETTVDPSDDRNQDHIAEARKDARINGRDEVADWAGETR